jgi:hypothetical protein
MRIETIKCYHDTQRTWKASVYANSGISFVVPAQQLKDLLESSELQRVRDETVERLLNYRTWK